MHTWLPCLDLQCIHMTHTMHSFNKLEILRLTCTAVYSLQSDVVNGGTAFRHVVSLPASKVNRYIFKYLNNI